MKRNAPSLLPFQIVMGVTTGAIGAIVAVLGELRDELGFRDTSIGIIVAAGFLASFLAQIVLAPYADRGHGRRMAVAGIALSSVSLIVMALVDAAGLWVASRAALGFAGGLLLPGLRRAATVLDPQRAGENLGRLIVGEIIGFVIGPIFAALLAEAGGIRLPFVVFGVGMAAFLPFVARLPADQGRQMRRARQSADLFGYRRLQGALVLIFGYFFLIGAFEAVLPLMVVDRGGGALETGIAFTIFAIPIAFVSTRAGRTADRLGAARVATIGMGISALVSISYGLIPGIWPLVAVMTLAGIADGFGFTAGQVAVSRAVPEERQAGALGLMGAAEVLGAGIAAIPAAAMHEAWGAGPTWMAAGAASLVLLLVGHLRLRGTEPVSPPHRPVGWTPTELNLTPPE